MNFFSTILNTLEILAHWAAFGAGAVVAYLTLRLPKVQGWLDHALLRGVAFVLLTYSLYAVISRFIPEIFELPRALAYGQDVILGGLQCVGGGLALASLAVGAYLVGRRTGTQP